MSIKNDTARDAERMQIALLQTAGVAGRLRRMLSLSHDVMALSKRAIARQNADAGVPKRNLAFVALHYGSELEKNVRDHLARRGVR